MAKRKGKSINLGMEDIVAGVGGAVAGMAINGVLNKVLEAQPENTRQMVGKFLPFAKIGAGGYVATNRKMSRTARMAGAGFAAAGGIEAAATFVPNLVAVGSATDVYNMIGSGSLPLPIAPSAPLENSSFADTAILGTDGYDRALL
ncbi:MAG: hypothetical protein AAF597_20790 [Bacteroidota bacterium]